MTIRSVLKDYEAALNAGDTDRILGLYGEQPVFMPQHAPALVGRQAVRAGYEHVFDTLRLDITFDIHEVEDLGDRAWARTSSAGAAESVTMVSMLERSHSCATERRPNFV